MKIIIQCAGEKTHNAGCLQTPDQKKILFVAQPNIAKNTNGYIYKTPNDLTENNTTWVQELCKYNQNNNNYLNLLPAYRLYDNEIYGNLVTKYGIENVYILSAGWGLINANFLTPNYNITFSKAKNVNKEFRRNKKDFYTDLCQIPLNLTEDLIFFGGIDYQPLFDKLTTGYKGKRIVFYNSINLPKINNCKFIKFETTQRTNWQYTCAKQLINGTISP